MTAKPVPSMDLEPTNNLRYIDELKAELAFRNKELETKNEIIRLLEEKLNAKVISSHPATV